MENPEADLQALVDYVRAMGSATKTDVVARFRWSPSRAVESLRRGVERGLLVRVEPEGREEPVAYMLAPKMK